MVDAGQFAAPHLERVLRDRHIRSLGNCTALDLTSCLPKSRKWTPAITHALGRSLLEYLEERELLAATPPTPTGRLGVAYQAYLERVRGLALVTAQRHLATVIEFLQYLRYDDRSRELRDLQVADIEGFLTHASHRVGRVTMQKVATALRTFLRFMACEGKTPNGLDAHIESPRHYRGERLPRAIPRDSVLALLRAVDRSSPKGRRDYAMLLLIATYGLRVSEVACLELDDIAWRSSQIRVPRPKLGTPLLLPLTDEIATALLDYLRHGRPTSKHRRLFLRVRVPQGPIKPTAVCDAFDAWATRAEICLPDLGGAHCLRHALAMHLLRQATPVKIIGDPLGHRSAESTGIYLRLNVEDLRDVSLPLPSAIVAERQP